MRKSYQSLKVTDNGGPIGRATVIVAVAWLSAIVVGMVVIIDRSNSPGHSRTPPAHWPTRSQIPRDKNNPTLIMFAHPRCPCTWASLGELELLLAQCPGRFSAHVMFIRPAGTAEDWADTRLWRKAAAIAGMNVHRDETGVEARRFCSETSGHTVLYDERGRLLFQGGITGSRGHSGDNPGRTAITAISRNEIAHLLGTPVFGCSLFEADCQEQGVECTN